MEEDLFFFKLEDDLTFFEKGDHLHFFVNGRLPKSSQSRPLQ